MDTKKSIEFTQIKSDSYGNPRYVCHFLNFADTYSEALNIAKKIGGRKFHNKQYGGGIVFQSYNIKDTEKKILNLLKPAQTNAEFFLDYVNNYLTTSKMAEHYNLTESEVNEKIKLGRIDHENNVKRNNK